MSDFTTSLPDSLLKKLSDASSSLGLPKDKIIEHALVIYLDQLRRSEYIKSYSLASKDNEIVSIAEAGMVDYLNQLAEGKKQ